MRVLILLLLFGVTTPLGYSAEPVPTQEPMPHEVVLTEAGEPVGDGADLSYRYWPDIETNVIFRARVGSADRQVFIPDLQTPYGIAYDQHSQQFLWTSSGAESVRVALSDGSGVREVLSSFSPPFAIVIESGNSVVQTLQTTEQKNSQASNTKTAFTINGDRIEKVVRDLDDFVQTTELLAKLDGSFSPWGLAYDPNHHQLYIGDEWGRMTWRLDVATKTLSQLIFNQSSQTPGELPGPIKDQSGLESVVEGGQ